MTAADRLALRLKLIEIVQWSRLPDARVEDTYEAENQLGNNIVGVQIEVWNRDVDEETELKPLTGAELAAIETLLGD